MFRWNIGTNLPDYMCHNPDDRNMNLPPWKAQIMVNILTSWTTSSYWKETLHHTVDEGIISVQSANILLHFCLLFSLVKDKDASYRNFVDSSLFNWQADVAITLI
jgi:hypothetical protein